MTAPAKPVLTITPWATGSYSAGASPWSGTAQRTTPPYNAFTPGGTYPAQYVNGLVGALTDSVGELQTWAKAASPALQESRAQRWGASVDPRGTNYGTMAAAFNPARGHWHVCSGQSTTSANVNWGLWKTTDSGENWLAAGGSLGDTVYWNQAMAFHATADKGIALTGFYSSSRIYLCNAETWTLGTGGTSPTPIGTAGLLFFGDRAVAAWSQGSALHVDYSDDFGATWTAGLSVTSGATSAGTCRLASNGTTLIASSVKAGAPLYLSTDGAAWTSHASPSTGSLGGVAWDATSAQWVATFQASSGSGDSAIYTSPDGMTWTLVSTLAGIYAADVACRYGVWFAAVFNVFAWGGQPNSSYGRVAYSVDGGATWRATSTTIEYFGTGLAGFVPTFALGADRLMISNGGRVRISGALEAGQPLTALLLSF